MHDKVGNDASSGPSVGHDDSVLQKRSGPSEHQVNVFRGNNQTAQGQFMARAPKLAAFYKNEARDVEIPIFGKNKNMTIAGRLSKDPSIGALVQVASRVHEDWLAQDKAAAQEQRAAAEEALRKLESQAA
jgi:hypothetical protein